MAANASGYCRVSKRSVWLSPLLALGLSVCGLGWSSYAFVSLQAGPLPFAWASTPVTFTIQQAGDPRITDGTDVTGVRLAFQAWEQVPGSRVSFVEDAASAARTDWRSDDLHLVTWDMTNESGFFGGSAGLVAITPVDFNPTTGEVLDADVLFNGKNYTFTTDLRGGTFDVQNVATHEVGHFIGLDHSGVVGATMNPFASSGDTRLRSLEQDDVAAASAIYPIGGEPGALEGIVTRNGQAVSGAHVVAEDMDGNPASAALSDGSGAFRMRGLDQGFYVVYAEPLDGPVRNSNFSLHTSGLTIDTSFSTTFYGEPSADPASGASSPLDPDRVWVSFGQTTRLRRNLTTRARASTPMNLTSISHLTVAPGEQVTLSVYGTGLDRATALLVPGTGIALGAPTFSSGSARATADVSGGAIPRLRTVRVVDARTNECAVLTGGFEVRAAAPLLESIEPATAAPGATLTILGAGFQGGARVLLDGEVVSGAVAADRVTVTLPALAGGTYHVTVENPDGQFARLSDALTVEAPAGGSGGSSSGSGTATTGGGPTTGTAGPTATASDPNPTVTQATTTIPAGSGGGSGGGCTVAPAGERSGSGLALAAVLGLLLALRRRLA